MSTFSKKLQEELSGLFEEAVSEIGIADDKLPRLLTLLIAKKSANNLSKDEKEVLLWVQKENAKKPRVADKQEVVPTKRGRVVVHDDDEVEGDEEDPTVDVAEAEDYGGDAEDEELALADAGGDDDNADEEEKDSLFEKFQTVNWLVVLPLLLGLVVVVFLGIRFVLPMIQEATTSGSQQGSTQSDEGESDSSQQPADLTGSVENTLLQVNMLKEKLNNPLLMGIFALSIIGLVWYTSDRGFDFDLDDIKMYLGVFLLFIFGISLPLDQWLGLTGETTYLGKMLFISPEIKIDLLLIVFMQVALVMISLSGVKDFTSLSLGNLFIGNILLIAYVSNFDTWFPPAIVLACWILGFSFHIIELNNQENFKQSMFIAAIGMGFEIVLFFTFATNLNPSSAFMIENLQLMSFLFAVGIVSVPIAIVMLIGAKTEVLAPMRGVQNAIDTALFDVLLLIGPFGGQIFLMYIWWNPI